MIKTFLFYFFALSLCCFSNGTEICQANSSIDVFPTCNTFSGISLESQYFQTLTGVYQSNGTTTINTQIGENVCECLDQNYNFCSLNNEISNNFTNVKRSCIISSFENIGNTHFIPVCTVNNIQAINCFNSCISNVSSNSVCSGDVNYAYYLSLYNVTLAPSTGFTCYCTMVEYNPSAYLDEVEPDNIIIDNIILDLYIQNRQIRSRGVMNPVSSNEMLEFFVNCFETYFTLYSQYANLTSEILITKNDYQNIINYAGGQYLFIYPTAVTVSTGNLLIDLFVNGSEYSTYSCRIISQHICYMKDCLFCADVFTNFKCLSTSNKIFIITILVVCFLLLLAAFPLLVKIIIWFVCVVFKFIIFPCLCCKKCLDSKLVNKMKLKIKNVSNAVKDELSPVEQTKPSVSRARLSFIAVLLLFLLLLTRPTSACSFGELIPVQLVNCLNNGTYTNCSTEISLIFSLTIPGESLCFSIVDANNNLWGTGQIIYEQLNAGYYTQLQYFTAPWNMEAEYTQRCYQAGNCPSDCSSSYPSDRTADNNLDDPLVINEPGFSGCQRGDSGWNHGCVYPSNICAYSGYGIYYNASSHNYAAVFVPYDIYIEPVIKLVINDATGALIVNTDVTYASEIVTQEGFTFTLNLVSESYYPSTSSIVVELEPDDTILAYYIGGLSNTSPLNSPTKGLFGDIQASSLNSLKAGGVNAFIFDPTMISESINNNGSTTFYYQEIGFGQLVNMIPLPATFLGELFNPVYDVTEQSLVVEITAGLNIAVRGSVSTNQNVTLNKNTDIICPIMSFINVTGCYQCGQGFSMAIHAHSTCLSGLVVLSDNSDLISLTINSLSLTTQDSIFWVYGYSEVSNPDVCFSINANGGSAQICPTFDLIKPDYVKNFTWFNSTNYPNFKGSTNTKFLDAFKSIKVFFERIFHGVAKWYELFIFVIILIFIGVFIFILLPSSIRSIKNVYDVAKNKIKWKKK
jgi:hypothetical protein